MVKEVIKNVFAVSLLLFIWGLLAPGESLADYTYLVIRGANLKKIPLAVPRFQNSIKAESGDTMAREGTKLIEETLDFTCYFKMIEHGAFLKNPQEKGVSIEKINFKNWTSIGTELLIAGGLIQTGGDTWLELRLFDTCKSTLLLEKSYKIDASNQRCVIRNFCSEVIKLLTGLEGLFDSKIVFISTGTGTKEAYICDFDGYDPKQLTSNRKRTLSPALSADGK